jgi:hypothetical protein
MDKDDTDALSSAGGAKRGNKNSVVYRSIPPTGFVFHESRVGSTLVANILASNPW